MNYEEKLNLAKRILGNKFEINHSEKPELNATSFWQNARGGVTVFIHDDGTFFASNFTAEPGAIQKAFSEGARTSEEELKILQQTNGITPQD